MCIFCTQTHLNILKTDRVTINLIMKLWTNFEQILLILNLCKLLRRHLWKQHTYYTNFYFNGMYISSSITIYFTTRVLKFCICKKAIFYFKEIGEINSFGAEMYTTKMRYTDKINISNCLINWCFNSKS